MEEANVQPVRCPVTVCGDIHGQFVSSLLLLEIDVHPSTSPCWRGPSNTASYVFLFPT